MASLSGTEWISNVYEFMFGPQTETPEIGASQQRIYDTYRATGIVRDETEAIRQQAYAAGAARLDAGKWTAYAFAAGIAIVVLMLATGKK